MTKTRGDLIGQVLSELKVVATGQPIAAEDAAVVDAKIEPVVADLAASRALYLADLDSIPLEVFLPLATIIAGACASDFGATRDRLPDGTDILSLAAEKRLRAQATRPTYTTLQVDYF